MSLIDNERKIKELQAHLITLEAGEEYDLLTNEIDELIKATYDNLTAWDRVCLARHPSRPKRVILLKDCSMIFMSCMVIVIMEMIRLLLVVSVISMICL